MRLNYTMAYRLVIVVVLAVLTGSVLGGLQSGRLTILLSGDFATVIVAIAEALIALAIGVQVTIEGSSFFWAG
jgi:hypothetical protein